MKKNLDLSAILKKTAKRLKKSEDYILEEINRVCLLIANQNHFAYYSAEDIKQEGFIVALQLLNTKYDFKRPLANFLYISVRNSIINLKRKICTRTDPPCLSCHQSVDGHTEHEDGRFCQRYRNWHKINFSKKSLSQPLELEEKPLADADIVGESAEVKDLLQTIDKVLPVELRSTYLRMRANEPVDETQKEKVEDFIKDFLYCETN